MRYAGLDGQRQRLRIHMRDHQQLAVLYIRDHGGDETVLIEAGREGAGAFEFRLVGGRLVERKRHWGTPPGKPPVSGCGPA